MHSYLGNYCLSYTSYYKNYGISHYWYFQVSSISGIPRNFVRGVQQIQLRTEDRENGDLGAVAPLPPSQGFWRQLQFGTRNFISYSKVT